MFIIDSNDTIVIEEVKSSDFNGRTYFKALVQFPKGYDWVSVNSRVPIGTYEGFSLVFDRNKVSLSV